MKFIVPVTLTAVLIAHPILAQIKPPTSFGGGDSVTISGTKGTSIQSDTTARTKTEDGVTVETSTNQNDGQTPNGGVGSGGNTSEGGGEK